MSFSQPYQRTRSFGLAILMVWAVGCATTRRVGFQGDYSMVAFGDDVFKIVLESRQAFDQQMGEALLLRRAAEVTLQNGFTHFVVISQDRATGLGFVARPGMLSPVRETNQAITIRSYRFAPELASAIDARQWLPEHPVVSNADTAPSSTP